MGRDLVHQLSITMSPIFVFAILIGSCAVNAQPHEYGIKDVLEKCLKECPKIIMPVCDSEGITHNNICEFEVRQCVAKETSGRDITVVHEGVCLNEYGIKDVLEKCIKQCPKTMAPVCDNEGITHNNKCEFEGRQCIAKETTGRDIVIVHEGVCLNEDYGLMEALIKCRRDCGKIYAPVCDNKGVTHNNKCLFEGRKCIVDELGGKDLVIKHEGACSKEYGIKDVRQKCLKECPKIMKPVCDNEGITHNNKCEFEGRQCIAKGTSGRDIVIVHDGVCLN